MSLSPPPRPVVLCAENVWKSYDNNAIRVLRSVDFQAFSGETVALCGCLGCGKITLLHLLGGLDEPDRGRITVNRISSRTSAALLRMHRHEVGFVFQLHNLIPDLTLEENCLVPSVAAGLTRREAKSRLRHLVDRTGIGHRLNQRIQNLSGGERQRTALCRALMNRPRILLADEPTGSLDENTRTLVFQLLLEMVAQEDITLVMATHERELAERCNRVIVMKDGKTHQR